MFAAGSDCTVRAVSAGNLGRRGLPEGKRERLARQNIPKILGVWRLHIARGKLGLYIRNVGRYCHAVQEQSEMRKLLILTTLSILPAFGCADAVESLRRFEVWKLQNFCEPTQPVVSAPPCSNPCAAPAAPACGCPQGAPARPLVIATPAAVSAGYAGTPDDAGVVVPGSIKTTDGPTLSTEELNGILKQP